VSDCCSQRSARGSSDEILIHTCQHDDYEMSTVFFAEPGLPDPTHHPGVGSGTHGAQTGQILERLEAALVAEQPALALVYGDTNSTLAAALAAAKLHVPVAHVEAGCARSIVARPEEINRVITDHLSMWLFCPCEDAVRNLGREGIDKRVHVGVTCPGWYACDRAPSSADSPCPGSRRRHADAGGGDTATRLIDTLLGELV
jgi:UDP-GlcNAc3NAcA epimerase